MARASSCRNRELLKHLLFGSPKQVKSAIHSLHVRDYAEAVLWSPLLPTPNLGEVMSMLIRYIQQQ
ncbi:MAG: hypothetical protein ICV55_09570 [Coleofasciculus sp. C3-bin4]|nr:hypothetical protein [Coleofasciculus sp. C3-bin4]